MTLLLTRRDVATLLTLDECISAVETAFSLPAEGRAVGPGALGLHVPGGGFHVKAAGLRLQRFYVAAKLNANFPANPSRRVYPPSRGSSCSPTGRPGSRWALMDSMEITRLRTGAATAVAARHLARADARVATVVGCGRQGRIQLAALARVRRLERAYAIDVDPAVAGPFAEAMSRLLGVDVRPAVAVTDVVPRSDICVTCTPSREPILRRADVAPGTFVAAVGADNDDKQELEPALIAASTVVVDSLEQCAMIGDLHHALAQGPLTTSDVHANLAEVVAGHKPGRRSADEIVIFDSTGVAIEDVAAAAYEKALAAGHRASVDLAT